MPHRKIFEIAHDIERDAWSNSLTGVPALAQPALEAMRALSFVTDDWGGKSAVEIVEGFLRFSSGYRTNRSAQFKAELKAIIGQPLTRADYNALAGMELYDDAP